jgi:hypothetical protein
MVLDAQSLEDAAPVGGDVSRRTAAFGRLLTIAGLASLAGVVPAAAQDATSLIAPYLQARDAHSVGTVAARALGDPPRPTASPVPYEGVSVMLLPHSSEFEAQLQSIKEHFRDSLKHYMDATVEVTDARAAYERTLLAAGGGELIRGEVSDARGVARLAPLPAGEWILLAWRSQPHGSQSAKPRHENLGVFRDVPVSTGYWIVTYWLAPLAVRAGETTEVALGDRNVWLTAVREERSVRDGASKTGASKKRR